ncbi:DUF697 domain-containing protein [Cyclonatronum proteinivorum]|nr:DUF697 domain-containing protein [Cyclonatronum proteinivorum]
MKQQIRKLMLISAFALSFLILIIIINQLVQFSAVIARLNETAGLVFLILSLSVLLLSVSLPVLAFLKLPGALIPPPVSEGPAYEAHLKKLARRLNQNPSVQAHMGLIEGEEQIQGALVYLNGEATEKVKQASRRAFFTTAISQNGALDALFILGLQFRLIWDIAHVYSQRPSLKDLGFLYSNVFVTALVASQLDEAEYFEMIESVITTSIGSAVTFVPGTALIVNSALNGTSNAFLTLRIGMIAQEYCSAIVRPERRLLRNSATVKAARMLGVIARDATADLIAMTGKAGMNKAGQAGTAVGDWFKGLFRG